MKKTGKQDRIRKIIVVLWMNGAAGRDILSGIFRFASAHKHWRIRLLQLPDNFTAELLDTILANGVDGIITSETALPPVARLLDGSQSPVVCIGPTCDEKLKHTAPVAYVSCDDQEIGMLGARHFLSCGNFRCFGFVSAGRNISWSDEREAGFFSALRSRRTDCLVFRSGPTGSDWNLDQEKLGQWIESIPKPAAIMAAFDFHAIQVLDVCREHNIPVPGQVCVLGVDNDELLCDFSTPPLSSIRPDHERAGFLAAAELEALMTRPRRKPHNTVSPITGVVERETTRFLSPSAHIVRTALAIIERETSKGITAREVVSRLGISRRLADLRFREICGRSILEEIKLRRLAIARDLLATSDYPVSRIATFAGYRSVKAFAIAFHKATGESPSAFRRTGRTD